MIYCASCSRRRAIFLCIYICALMSADECGRKVDKQTFIYIWLLFYHFNNTRSLRKPANKNLSCWTLHVFVYFHDEQYCASQSQFFEVFLYLFAEFRFENWTREMKVFFANDAEMLMSHISTYSFQLAYIICI